MKIEPLHAGRELLTHAALTQDSQFLCGIINRMTLGESYYPVSIFDPSVSIEVERTLVSRSGVNINS
eukprot:scaffold5962_cov80-Skeletonema_dohrnii-CCMP3373.AAC.1